MSDLRKFVERIVRPIQGSQGRKNRMRADLLAHFERLVEDEQRAPEGAEGALERARVRLGDAAELISQLQDTVPAWERWACWPVPGLRHLERQPSESMSHFLARQIRFQLIAGSLAWGGMIAAAVAMGSPVARKSPLTGIAIAILVQGYLTGALLLTDATRRCCQAWPGAGPSQRRLLTLRLGTFALAHAGLAALLTIVILSAMDRTAGGMVFSPATVWGSGGFAALASLPLLAVQAWSAGRQVRQFDNWDGLDLSAE